MSPGPESIARLRTLYVSLHPKRKWGRQDGRRSCFPHREPGRACARHSRSVAASRTGCGTGRFRFARGQVVERLVGRNTTLLRKFGNSPNGYAPNYRFEFEVELS